MRGVPAHFFTPCVGATDPLSSLGLLVARLLAAAVVAAELRLAAGAAAAHQKTAREEAANDRDGDRTPDHNDIELDDATGELRASSQATHNKAGIAIGQPLEKVECVLPGHTETEAFEMDEQYTDIERRVPCKHEVALPDAVDDGLHKLRAVPGRQTSQTRSSIRQQGNILVCSIRGCRCFF